MQCTYILLNALSYVIQDVTKILVGASALMSDGSILGPVGTGCVALTAHMHNIPFLVCCETYKISNKLYLESITHNELGNPNALTVERGEEKKGDDSPASSPSPTLKRLHLTYDLTPAAFVSGIVTELGIVPATSVAVLLREMNPQDSRKYDE
jgi:translation initiation factor eIF-2B subunit delta